MGVPRFKDGKPHFAGNTPNLCEGECCGSSCDFFLNVQTAFVEIGPAGWTGLSSVSSDAACSMTGSYAVPRTSISPIYYDDGVTLRGYRAEFRQRFGVAFSDAFGRPVYKYIFARTQCVLAIFGPPYELAPKGEPFLGAVVSYGHEDAQGFSVEFGSRFGNFVPVQQGRRYFPEAGSVLSGPFCDEVNFNGVPATVAVSFF